MYLSTSTSTEDFPEMYLSTFQVLYKLYLSTDVLKYKVLLPGSDAHRSGNGSYLKKLVPRMVRKGGLTGTILRSGYLAGGQRAIRAEAASR